MGSIPATLDITFLKRRTSSSQFLRKKRINRLLISPKKAFVSSAAIAARFATSSPTPTPTHLNSRIWLTRIRNGKRLNPKPYQIVRGGKTRPFFTFKTSIVPYFPSTQNPSTLALPYFWQTYVPHVQFFWSSSLRYPPQLTESGNLPYCYLRPNILTTPLTPSQTLFYSQSYPSLCPPALNLPNVFDGNLPKLLQAPTLSSLYVSRASEHVKRSITLRLNSFQKILYSQTKYYKMLKRSVARFNVTSRHTKNRFLVLYPYQLSHQLLSGLATREPIPDFRDISRNRPYFTPSFAKASSLQGLVLSKKRKALTRTYGHLSPYTKISRPMWFSSQGAITERTLARSKFTQLIARVFRQFMIKRLFRPTPVKTYTRSIRRIRKCWNRTRFSDILPQVKKARKLASDRLYEEALFKEMLSTPPGVEGPLLKTFRYTGFEAMPMLNQKLGNTLFKKNRRLRPVVLESRVPNRGKRRHVVRTQLRLSTPWAQHADLLRPLIKELRDHNSAVAPLHRTSVAEKRRYRYTLRYWRKRTAYFFRHSVALTALKRTYFRFRRKLRFRKKRFSRNFIIRRELRLLTNLATPVKRSPRLRRSTRTRRKRKRKKKLKGVKLSFARRVLLNFRFRFLQQRLRSEFNSSRKSFWVRRRSVRKKSRLYKRLRLRAKPGLTAARTIPHSVSHHFKDFIFLKRPRTHRVNSSQKIHPTNLMPLGPVLNFWFSPALRKYSFFYQMLQLGTRFTMWQRDRTPTYALNFALALQNQLNSFCFNPLLTKIHYSNLWTYPSSHHLLRKKLLRSISQSSFGADTGSWVYKCLIQFAERMSGRRAAIYIGPFVDQALTLEDHARCILWNIRSSGFKKMLGHRIFTSEALMVLTASIRLKDPTLLSNWIRGMLKRMSFWKYRVIFRYLKFLLQHLFRFSFPELHFRGFKLRLKGKISVGGNSRSRVLFYRVGDTSHSKMSNKIAYDLSYINTFTGVLGFKLWFFY